MKTLNIYVNDVHVHLAATTTPELSGQLLSSTIEQIVPALQELGAAAVPLPRFARTTADGSPTEVLDRRHNLVWSDTLANGEQLNHADAEKACAALGDGWRLPTIDELLSLVDYTRREPAIDIAAFPDTKSSWYWTASSVAGSPSGAWLVDSGYGGSYAFSRSSDACVRAVRVAGPAGQ